MPWRKTDNPGEFLGPLSGIAASIVTLPTAVTASLPFIFPFSLFPFSLLLTPGDWRMIPASLVQAAESARATAEARDGFGTSSPDSATVEARPPYATA